jgi:phosphoenolpyruvate synthase/pyruvate phosphate dikinase
MPKTCYLFGGARSDGDASMKPLLGGKGANLAEMANLGIPVPPGFTITTEVCLAYLAGGGLPPEARAEILASLTHIEQVTGRTFGDPDKGLLVSVRSGARASMPGMMDTILNLGLNDQIVEGLAKATGNGRFAFDAYRRFIAMFSDVVLGISKEKFEHLLDEPRRRVAQAQGLSLRTLNAEQLKQQIPDHLLSEAELREVVRQAKAIVLSESGQPFPEAPLDQLWAAVGAVFHSWDNARAKTYRQMNQIPDEWGTACTIQAMVFGNLGDTSATGVAFTRDPRTGERRFFGEWLPNAQGEDVVAGTRTPFNVSRYAGGEKSLEALFPAVYADLERIYQSLERHYRDMMDIEFTVQEGKLYMLQCRVGGRNGRAQVRIAVDMVREGLITREEAILRVTPSKLDELLHPTLDPDAPKTLLATGLPAGPGAATGHIVFSAEEAEKKAAQGKSVILVRRETSPEDIHGMKVAAGILTSRGGMTCVAGETRVLTDRGLLSAEAAFALFEQGEQLRILSFDTTEMRPVWRTIVAAGRKPGKAITVSVSQTGRAEQNELRLTSDHKMFTIEQRQLRKKPLEQVLADEDFLTIVDRLPALTETQTPPALAYVAGALFADGHVMLKPTKGSVTFIQKPTPEKAEFIAAVESCFLQTFGVPFTYVRERETTGTLQGREIKGSVEDRISFRRDPAERLARLREQVGSWVLGLDRTALLSFLAGYVDGDGTYAEESSAVRLQISVAAVNRDLLEALALACLRLGIVPQITNNRDNFTLQIAEQVDEILGFTHRIKAEIPPRQTESRCLSVKGLFGDIAGEVNYMGRVREGVKRNIMFGAEKIRRDIRPLCRGEARRQLDALLDAPLRSYRVRQTGEAEETLVYNFEVEADGEVEGLDKNYVAFSSRLTPVLVSNSHAAVVARVMGKCCVAGCSSVQVNYDTQTMSMLTPEENGQPGKQVTLKAGDIITLSVDNAGKVYLGEVPMVPANTSAEYEELMGWADQVRTMKVRANADKDIEARSARSFGAEGIGLCRTEHMFFDPQRITIMRQMIVADTVAEREKALDQLLPFQRSDFAAIFREMKGLPVTIRLLDPPLHEFLPTDDEQFAHLAGLTGLSVAELHRRTSDRHEVNPMLGHRGVRLAVTYPEIYAMQVRAILEAACDVAAEGVDVQPEIMIPLALGKAELTLCRRIVDRVAREVFAAKKREVAFKYGTMIELPRAALRAGDLAEEAEFFSFGTNDLTQTTLGLSRDDAGRFTPAYIEHKIFATDPFQTLDLDGVGELVRIAVARGRQTRPDIKLGICGEHGGDPTTIGFCHEIGLAYVSCSPFRVPIARLAAAQAALRARKS